MKYEDICHVNSMINMKELKSKKRGTVKEYAVVDEKIKAFRRLFPDGGIDTTILSIKDGVCVAQAKVTDAGGHVLGSGTASKIQTKDNSDSYIEACETAAVGRALRFLGIGLENMMQHERPAEDPEVECAKLREKIIAYTVRHKFDEQKIKAICNRYKVNALSELNYDCCKHYIQYMTDNGGDIDK